MSSFDAFLNINYTLSESDNFDKYLEVLGVSFVQRGLATRATPVATFSKNGDVYTYASVTTFKTVEMKFQPGVEFDFETLDGRKVKVTVTFEGNKMIEIQTEPNGRKHTFVRTFTKEKFDLVMEIVEADGTVAITATRVYTAK